MANIHRVFLVLVALVAVVLVPLTATAQQEATTTTAEIEISATSITSTTEGSAVGSGGESPTTEDTLPFTGTGSSHLVGVALIALLSGAALIALTRHHREDAKTD